MADEINEEIMAVKLWKGDTIPSGVSDAICRKGRPELV